MQQGGHVEVMQITLHGAARTHWSCDIQHHATLLLEQTAQSGIGWEDCQDAFR